MGEDALEGKSRGAVHLQQLLGVCPAGAEAAHAGVHRHVDPGGALSLALGIEAGAGGAGHGEDDPRIQQGVQQLAVGHRGQQQDVQVCEARAA